MYLELAQEKKQSWNEKHCNNKLPWTYQCPRNAQDKIDRSGKNNGMKKESNKNVDQSAIDEHKVAIQKPINLVYF